MLLISSTIIQNILAMCRAGLANLAFFYFDPQDAAKQDVRNLLAALLIQLCDQSDRFLDILSSLYSIHRDGSQQPSEDELTQCLKAMMSLPAQPPIYVVVDGLDCCPNFHGFPSPRKQVLKVMEELIDSRFPHLHLCVTSRPEIDIRRVLEPLWASRVALQDEHGQMEDIADYIKSAVYSDTMMRRWPEGDKRFVIDALTERSGGMYVKTFIIPHYTFL